MTGRAVKRYMDVHPGIGVSVKGPGARDPSEKAKAHFCQDLGPTRMVANDGECTATAIVHAVDCVKGRTSAMAAKEALEENCPYFKNLGSAIHAIHQLGLRCELRKVKFNAVGAIDDWFSYLAKRTRGIFLVRVEQRGVADHCFVIDGHRRLIIDSEEPYPMRLPIEALRIFGGDQADKLRVAEVSEFFGQDASVKNKKK